MVNFIKLFLFSMSLFFVSCSTMKQKVIRNNKFAEKLTSSLFYKNGNVFFLSSSYATFSFVWTYTEDRIEIYHLENGKISEQLVLPSNGIFMYGIPTSKEVDLEIKDCGYELDGDILGFMIKVDSEINEQVLPIGIDCFTKLNYKSDFLNKVVKDIKTHKLWDVKNK